MLPLLTNTAIVPSDQRACSSSGAISISRGEDSSPSSIERSDQKEREREREVDYDDEKDDATDVSADPEQDLLGPRNIVARWVQ